MESCPTSHKKGDRVENLPFVRVEIPTIRPDVIGQGVVPSIPLGFICSIEHRQLLGENNL
jgi:hypothetical protein